MMRSTIDLLKNVSKIQRFFGTKNLGGTLTCANAYDPSTGSEWKLFQSNRCFGGAQISANSTSLSLENLKIGTKAATTLTEVNAWPQSTCNTEWDTYVNLSPVQNSSSTGPANQLYCKSIAKEVATKIGPSFSGYGVNSALTIPEFTGSTPLSENNPITANVKAYWKSSDSATPTDLGQKASCKYYFKACFGQ
jgi:hypothetical protein